MSFGQTKLPWHARMLDARQRRRAGAAIVPADQDRVGVGLRNSGRNRAHADFGDQLHADPRPPVSTLEVVDQFLQVLNRIDVVMRRRRNQTNARS
jgi:hypothetical protein